MGFPLLPWGKESIIGKDKDSKRKGKLKCEKAATMMSDHSFEKGRKLIQPSKKMDCPVKFVARKIMTFLDFCIPIDSTKFRREEMAKFLRKALISMKSGGQLLSYNLQFLTEFPTLDAHRYHHIGQAAGLIEPLDERVKEYIKQLVRGKCRKKQDILSRTADFVKSTIFGGESHPDRLRRRFKPTGKTIKNLIAGVQLETTYSKFDQENVQHQMEEWKKWIECVSEPLPKKGKKSHPFSGRYGSHAEVMKNMYRVKVPLPEDNAGKQANVLVDGVIDITQSIS